MQELGVTGRASGHKRGHSAVKDAEDVQNEKLTPLWVLPKCDCAGQPGCLNQMRSCRKDGWRCDPAICGCACCQNEPVSVPTGPGRNFRTPMEDGRTHLHGILFHNLWTAADHKQAAAPPLHAVAKV